LGEQVGRYLYSSGHIHRMTCQENANQPTQPGNLSYLDPILHQGD
jgi:hypothetical protein